MRSATSVPGIVSIVCLVAFVLLWFWRRPLKRKGLYVPASFSFVFGALFAGSWVVDRTSLPTIMYGLLLALSLCQVLVALLSKE
jgi:hypothetical protein